MLLKQEEEWEELVRPYGKNQVLSVQYMETIFELFTQMVPKGKILLQLLGRI